MLETYLATLEMGYFEVSEALRDLADENVWKRPADKLLSIGEMAAHIAYGEAVHLSGEGGKHPPNLEKCGVSSALIDHRFRYYPYTIADQPTDAQRAMTAQQVRDELLRVHNEIVAGLRERNPDLQSPLDADATFKNYEQALQYMIFHVSYHTGQIVSARYLLGENPPDN